MRIKMRAVKVASFITTSMLLLATHPVFAASDDGSQEAQNFLANIATWLSSVVGGVSIIAMIWAAIVYATSGGNLQSIQKAKDIFKYAVIGLILAAIAGFIVAKLNIIVHNNFGG
jgi:hypothetical protein